MRRVLPAAAVIGCLLVCRVVGPAAAETVSLRYGRAFSAERSIFSLPVHVADRHGDFAREGLAVRQYFIPGGAEKMIEALSDDTVDVTHVATPFLIQNALKGADVVAIAAELNNPIYILVAKPDIRGLASAFQFIRDPANRDAVAATIVETSGFSDVEARRTLALFFEPERNVMPKRGEIDLNGLRQTIALMTEGGQLPAPPPDADRFVDLQYLRAAGVQ